MSVQSLAWMGWAAAAVVGHWLVPARCRDAFVAGVTLLFLCVYSPASAVFLASLSIATYAVTARRPVSGRSVAVLAAVIVSLLVGYKIYSGPIDLESGSGWVVPLGMSYYTLRCLHYAIECYKGTIPPHTFGDFVAYQFFLPTLIAGPIHRFPQFHRDRNRRRWDADVFSAGLERILFGLTKIVVLGNFLVSELLGKWISAHVIVEDGVIGSSGDPWLPLFVYLDLLRYGVNLYFQFSGYSDVAIGLGMLLGIKVMENFNWPFLKKNVAEFWQSWHISLTGWCREYIYMVVISNWRSPALAAITTMLAIGCWHEVSLRYLLWGVYHGLGVAVWQVFQRLKPRLPQFTRVIPTPVLTGLSVALTFHFIIFGFSIVQGPSLGVAMQRWSVLFLSWG